MSSTLKAIVLAAAIVAIQGQQASAVFTSKGSDLFPKKYEMDNVAQGLDPNASTATHWTFGSSGSSAASLSGGVLNLNTGPTSTPNRYWQTTSGALNTVGSTIEVRLRIDSFVDGSAPTLNRTFQVFFGDNIDGGALVIGPTTTYWRSLASSTFHNNLGSHNNSNGMHVFRIAQEANSNQYTVWRDDELLASNLLGGFAGPTLFYFGDGTGDCGGSGAFDYVRYDLTGGFGPVPEPSCALLLGIGGLFIWRRRVG